MNASNKKNVSYTVLVLTATAVIGLLVLSLTPPADAHKLADHGKYMAAVKSSHGHGGSRRHSRMLFEQYDHNHDGSVSTAEVERALKDSMERFDTSGDGTLSLEEYQQLWLERMREKMVDMFQHVDADGDGAITASERRRLTDHIFDKLDHNQDQHITKDEIRKPRHAFQHDKQQYHGS